MTRITSDRLSPTERAKKLHQFCITRGLTIVPRSIQSIIPAPVTLYPTPFPRSAFQKALQVQHPIQKLYRQLARDEDFINQHIGPIAQGDPFIERLYKIWQDTKHLTKSRIELQIYRSDYLVDKNSLEPKQVELNSIACAFSSLSQKTFELHKYLDASCKPRNVQRVSSGARLPQNGNIANMAEAFIKANDLYAEMFGRSRDDLAVLVVAGSEEGNVMDQHWLEIEIGMHGIHVMRKSLTEIANTAELDSASQILKIDGWEISIVYFRSGYSPSDYISETEWTARRTLESSRCVLASNVGLQLTGSKKVQEVLITNPSIMRKYLPEATARLVETTFMQMMPLADGLDHAKQGTGWVLKPQREGGGNNVYGEDIPAAVEKMTKEVMDGYTLMERIDAAKVDGVLVRNGDIWQGSIVSELGIYGAVVCSNDTVFYDETTGYLLRTKQSNANEGGVNVGISVMDCPLLMDDASFRQRIVE